MSDDREKPMDGLKMKYFVMKPEGDDAYAMASRRGMRMYADTIQETNPQLARDLYKWTDNEWLKTPGAKAAGKALGRANPE